MIVKKMAYLFREMLGMIRRNKMYFFAPILLTMVVLSILVYYIGPGVIMTFVYAGF